MADSSHRSDKRLPDVLESCSALMVPSVYARRQTRGLSRINGCEDTVHGLHAGPRGRLSSYHDELARGRDVTVTLVLYWETEVS